jgi:hypothetical protein
MNTDKVSITIKEAMKLTGLSDKTIRRKIVDGTLQTDKNVYPIYKIFIDSLQPYIKQQEWEEYISREDKAIAQGNARVFESSDPIQTPATVQPAMFDMELKEILDITSSTFKAFTDDNARIAENNARIAESYQQLLAPVIKRAVNPGEEVVLNEMLEMQQKLTNNLIVMVKGGLLQTPPDVAVEQQEDLFLRLFDGLGMPPALIKQFSSVFTQVFNENDKSVDTIVSK